MPIGTQQNDLVASSLAAATFLNENFEQLPTSNEAYQKETLPVALVSTRTLREDMQWMTKAFVFFGFKQFSNGRRLVAPTIRIDDRNVMWCEFNDTSFFIRAVLLDGEFTAVSRFDFQPGKRTRARYGVSPSDVASSLDSSLAQWLRYQGDDRPESLRWSLPDVEEYLDAGLWSRSLARFCSAAFMSIAEFYSSYTEEEQQFIGTFLEDGLDMQDAITAAQSISQN